MLGAPKTPTKGSSSPHIPKHLDPAPAAGPAPTEGATRASSASPSPAPVGTATAPSPLTSKEGSAASKAEKLPADTAQETILNQSEKYNIFVQLNTDLDAIKALNEIKLDEASKRRPSLDRTGPPTTPRRSSRRTRTARWPCCHRYFSQ
jgi:hypothetical protein